METCNYRITEGGDYGWHCFGYNAYSLDSWNGDQNGHTLSIVFDTRTQEVYQALAYDYSRDRAYRMTNPSYKDAFNTECKDREILDCAWELDDGTPVKYIDLETVEDWMEKAWAICNDQEYDTRIQVPLTLPDDALFQLMKLAHEQDLTLNQMVEGLLRDAINNEEMLKEWVGQDVVVKNPPFVDETNDKFVGKMKKGKK